MISYDHECSPRVSVVTSLSVNYRYKLCSKVQKMHQNLAFPGIKFHNFLHAHLLWGGDILYEILNTPLLGLKRFASTAHLTLSKQASYRLP